jgi:predicted DNA binding CopG/RHH family protein
MHRKVLTSVALDRDLVEAIKKAAEERGVPYQVLLRMLVIDGFKSWQKSA